MPILGPHNVHYVADLNVKPALQACRGGSGGELKNGGGIQECLFTARIPADLCVRQDLLRRWRGVCVALV